MAKQIQPDGPAQFSSGPDHGGDDLQCSRYERELHGESRLCRLKLTMKRIITKDNGYTDGSCCEDPGGVA